MLLRQGKTKSLLEGSIDAALLAVEVYNKPRTVFRSQNYITLMVIAWTYLFHAYFFHHIGNKFYYKETNGRYKLIDGERKAWELATCINKYGKIKETVRKNLEFFIGLRNKIEHKGISEKQLDATIFGECQSLLYNYESFLDELFGDKYILNEHLVYSLQFSKLRTEEQKRANKKVLSPELANIQKYIEDYRSNLTDEIFSSQEYSIKLIQIPRISNTSRNDMAIEFINWNELNEEDKAKYHRLATLIKDKVIIKEAVNIKRLKPGQVCQKLYDIAGIKLGTHYHLYLCIIFSIRPSSKNGINRSVTNIKYCHYDETHGDYVYEEQWADFIINAFRSGKLNKEFITTTFKQNGRLNIEDFR